ncbi:hypothetical protein K2X89_05895 [Myxococcota bacterium]|nr:hypothetical protein [Myxococcota bacterium]
MAIDSNFSGDDRGGASMADKAAAAGLKLVSERGASAGGTGVGSGAAAGTSGATAARGDLKTTRQLPLWMFGVLFVLFLLGYGYQTHHASQLETEVLRLQESLAKAESRLESHRTHLLEIRTGVHDLSARLESLRVLIDRDPTSEPARPPASPQQTPVVPGKP